MKILLVAVCLCSSVFACVSTKTRYAWNEITSTAAYPKGYNYPVFVINGEMLALNNGGWISRDGKNWTKTNLPESGLNSAYQKFVEFSGSIYALGAMQGNYLNFRLSTRILHTSDGKTWKTAAERSNLPERIFYGAVVFKNKIWILGGFDGQRYYNDVWNSPDAVNWTRVAEKTNWSPRTISKIIVFKNHIRIIGGGVIDGDKADNPDSESEIWSSADGINWSKSNTNATNKIAGTPAVFDDKLWLIGANRNDGNFSNAVLVSGDGEMWQELSAPWTPRGGTAVWVFDGRLFMTGGKYSNNEPDGALKFVYSNDVWAMSKITD